MSDLRNLRARAWWIIPIAAVCFVFACALVRVRHIDGISHLGGGAEAALDPYSPTGYAGGVRALVLPEPDRRSMQWIVQAQELVQRGAFRLDRVAYDNAPQGRPVRTASPYRWWLVIVGWIDSLMSPRSLAAGIERAGLWADPLLQIGLLLAVVFMFRQTGGSVAASWAVLPASLVFPVGASFLPGRPDDFGMAVVAAVASVVLMAGALCRPEADRRRPGFILGGVAGGVGLWLAPGAQVPVMLGLAAGGVAAGLQRVPPGAAASDAAAWRGWGMAAACTSLAGWLVESLPGLSLFAGARLEANHPAYALLWLGCAECVARVHGWRAAAPVSRSRGAFAWFLAISAMAVLPIMLLATHSSGFLADESLLARVSDFPGAPGGDAVRTWFATPGLFLRSVAMLLPVLAGVVLAALLLVRVRPNAGSDALWVALGPLVVTAAGVLLRPGYVTLSSAMLPGLVGPLVLALRDGNVRAGLRTTAAASGLCAVGLGLVTLWPRESNGAGDAVSPLEAQSLIERDLAWWLARRAPGSVVFAPPDLTAGLIYHGGLRGLGSPYPENSDGFRASVRLAGATSPVEAQALAQQRGVRFIVMPSWDDFLDRYADLGANDKGASLIALLHRWLPPRWLRPVSYVAPQVEGLSPASAIVFEVTDTQDNATALSRLAEYFIETGRFAQASQVGRVLKEQFPADPAAVVARAEVALARHDAPGFGEAVDVLLQMIEDGATDDLPWDQRVGLASVLAFARRPDLARDAAQRCLDEMDEAAVRSLSPASLNRFVGLLARQNLEIADPRLRRLARDLLPRELRDRFSSYGTP